MKRFYKEVEVMREPDGFGIALDGRAVKTPSGRALRLPGPALAEAIADEWREQGDEVNPRTMPLTRLANTVLDGVSERRAEVIAALAGYGETDLVCYWAEAPDTLVERQRQHWQPVLDWVSEHLGTRVQSTIGIGAIKQEARVIERLQEELETLDDFALAAFHEVTTLTGSVYIALAVAKGGADAHGAWVAAHVDEAFQTEQWGEDAEAKARLDTRRASYDDAVRMLQLLGLIP